MASSIERVRFLEFVIGLKSSLEARAGTTPQEAAQGRFKTKANAPRSLFEEMFEKLIVAIHDQDQTIDLNIQDDKWIIKD